MTDFEAKSEPRKGYVAPEVRTMDVIETRLEGGPAGEFVQPDETATGTPS